MRQGNGKKQFNLNWQLIQILYTLQARILDEEKEKQDQGTLAQIKREVRDKSLEKQVELYQREIKRLLGENENLKKEVCPLYLKYEKACIAFENGGK